MKKISFLFDPCRFTRHLCGLLILPPEAEPKLDPQVKVLHSYVEKTMLFILVGERKAFVKADSITLSGSSG